MKIIINQSKKLIKFIIAFCIFVTILQTRVIYANEQEADGFKYIDFESGIKITGTSKTEQDIVIPDEINGKKVLSIGENAFYNLGLTSIQLNESLKTIETGAFQKNKLTELVLTNNLTEVGSEAFRDNELTTLNLNNVTTIKSGAFSGNKLTNLDFSRGKIQTIERFAFSNNDLTAVHFPDSLTKLESGALSFNNRFVKVTSDANPITIPTIDKTENGFGYVVDPIRIIVSFVDAETQEKLLDEVVLGDDLTDVKNVFVKGEEQTYTPDPIQGYTLKAGNEIRFTPDVDQYRLVVEYVKKESDITLKQKPEKSLLIAQNTENIEEVLRDLVVASNKNGDDLSSLVKVEPRTIDTSVEGKTYEITYTVQDPETQEVKRLVLTVYIGSDLNNFPLDNGWVLGDFLYDGNRVIGFSSQGIEKVATNKNVVLPHINPTTNERITRVGIKNKIDPSTIDVELYSSSSSGLVESDFRNFTDIESIRDFDNNIEVAEALVFQGVDALESLQLNALRVVESMAFFGTNLAEIDSNSIEEIGQGGFGTYNRPFTKINLPNLTKLDKYGLYSYGRMGENPSFPKGVYLPKITVLPNHAFGDLTLEEVTSEQFPSLVEIQDSVIQSLGKLHIDLPLLKKIGSNNFYVVYDDEVVDVINLQNVEEIGANSFRNLSIKTVVAPKLQKIGENTFNYLRHLIDIDMPKLQEIGENTFNYTGLTSIQLPELRSIDGKAFQSSTGVEQYNNAVVIITNGSTDIPNRDNYVINPKEVDANAPLTEEDFVWSTTNPNEVLGFTNTGSLKNRNSNGNLVLPDRAQVIGAGAFRSYDLKSVVGNRVVEIKENAFGRNSLRTANFPNVTTIGSRAFYQQHNNHLDGFVFNGFEHVTSIGESAFESSRLRGEIVLPLVTDIPNSAFVSNQITKVTLPKVQTIGESAFAYNNIQELLASDLPELREFTGGSAFRNNNISNLVLGEKLQKINQPSTFESNPIGEVVLPKSLTEIDNNILNMSTFYRYVIVLTNPKKC